MSRVNSVWVYWRRKLRSIGFDLTWTMFGLAAFTAISVMMVVGYIFVIYTDALLKYSAEILVKRYKIPDAALNQLIEEASLRVERKLDLQFLDPSDRNFLLGLTVLTVLLPLILAWWSSRRFARPLTDLSKAAHQITSGDFSARAKLTKSLERREDETALLLQDFNQMAQSLENLERERKYSVAAIAHELRTPVTVLRGRLEGVRDGVLVADNTEIEKLLGHADLLSKLIEDLQLLSLAEAGELRLEKKNFVLQDLLIRIQSDFMQKAEQQKLELLLEQPPQAAQVHGDQQRLYQVLSNILNNALRHTPAYGLIKMQLRIFEQTIQLEIQDTGAGFSAEAQTRAFERFYRSADRSRKSGGSGLGLSISRSLIEAHNGTIELLPSQQGACVRLTLPKVSS